MKKLIITIIILISTTAIYACSCIGEVTVNEELKKSDLVIVGTVIDSQIVKFWGDTTSTKTFFDMGIKQGEIDSSLSYEYWKNNNSFAYFELIDFTVIVEKRFKGTRQTDTITVRTGFGGGDCGFNFNVGQRYLIYAEEEHRIKYSQNKPGREKKELIGIYRTNICWRTKPIAIAKKELRILKKN
ncbi:MAG: hypothetical protein HRT73_04250 [Flavobacteriales bacterium]|nr:hypothetical protein [Flavobacteriales bacterium]